MAAAGGAAWTITGEDRTKHDSQFFSLRPVNGFVTGDQAKGFFMQSGLPTATLGQIWTLADMNNDGKMDKKEFSIAMHLIKKKLQGYELPKSLPASLKADPVPPMVGSFGGMSVAGPGMMMGPKSGGVMGQAAMPAIGSMAPTAMVASPMTMPVMSNGVAPPMSQAGFGMMGMPAGMDGKPRAGSFTGNPQQQMGVGQSPFMMPHPSKLKYTQLFNTNDRNKRGSLTGVEARAIFLQTGIPQPILAQVWGLSDVDKDGKLTCDEFCIAMHLIDLVKMGVALPPALPPELLPAKGRSGSFGPPQVNQPHQPQYQPPPGKPKDAFEDLLGNMGMAPPQPLQPQANSNTNQEPEEDLSQVTFEDRRKENFAKGQAELDRRRQALQDQMRREQEARMQKERQEQEKKERIRQEQEMKRQMELEKHMEKQRQNEQAREEQRQKIMEQREAARRELERQRQMEWERQRKEQLLAEKRREYEQLGNLKSRANNLKCELESQEGKKTEVTQKISQVRNGVTDFTGSIESMRGKRDTKMSELDRLQNDLQLLNQNYQRVQQEREQLHIQMQTTVQSNPLSETHRTVLHSVELKKTTIQKMKKDLEQIERDTESQLQEIDNNNSDLSELNVKLKGLQNELITLQTQERQASNQQNNQQETDNASKLKQDKLRKELEAQRLREESDKKEKPVTSNDGSSWFAFGNDNKTTTESAQDDIWSSAFSSENLKAADNKQDNIWASAFSSQSTGKTSVSTDSKKTKYKVMYQFDARNADELALVPGEIIMVPEDQSGAEPGWMGGEKNSKTGWFPKDYVEIVQESVPSSQVSVMNAFSGAAMSSTPSSVPVHVTPVESKPAASTPPAKFVDDSSFAVVHSKPMAPSPTPGQGTAAPDGLQAQALYPWKAKKDNHLSFNKGDVIVVKEQQEMWWSGDLNGQVGWFPKSYVKLKGVALAGSNRSSRSQTPTLATEHIDGGGSARSTPQLSTPAPEGENYVAMYNYNSAEPGDLNFNQGDTIMITKTEGDWWTGTIGDKTGVFPANYVKKSDVQIASDGGFGLAGNLFNSECIPPVHAVLESAAAVFDQNLGTDTSLQSPQPAFDIFNSKKESSANEVSANAMGLDLNFDPFGGESNQTPGQTAFCDPFGGESGKTSGETAFSGFNASNFDGLSSAADLAVIQDVHPAKHDTDDVPPPLPPLRRKRSGAKPTKQTTDSTVTKQSGQGTPINSAVDTDDKLKSTSSPAPAFADFGNADPFAESAGFPSTPQEQRLEPEGIMGSPKNDEVFKDDPFSSFSTSDPFTENQKIGDFGVETDPFADGDPFENVGNNTPSAEALSDPFAGSQKDSTGGSGTGNDPFGGTDPFGGSGSSYLFGDTGIAIGKEMLDGVNSLNKSTSGDFETMANPFGGDDLFAGTANTQMSDIIALGRNLMSPNTDQEVSNAFANIPTESATSFNLNVSTSTTDLQNNLQHAFNPAAQSTITGTSSDITEAVAFPGDVDRSHVTDSPENTYEDICPPPLPSVSKIPPRPPKPPRQIQQPKTVRFEPEAIYEDLPNEFWTQGLGTTTKDQTDKGKLEFGGNLGDQNDSPIKLDAVLGETGSVVLGGETMEDTFGQIAGQVQVSQKLEGGELSFGGNPLSSSTLQEFGDDPFGGDFWATTGNAEQTQVKTGLDETYDDASVGGFVADFGPMTASSSEAVSSPAGHYGNVGAMSTATPTSELVDTPVSELSYENTDQSAPVSASPPKQNSTSKNKKKGKSWMNKIIRKKTSSSAPKEPKDVPDLGLYEEPVSNVADKKANPLNAATSSPQPSKTDPFESDLYEEINVAQPAVKAQPSTRTGVAKHTQSSSSASNVSGETLVDAFSGKETSVMSSVIPEPAPASTSQSKSGSLPLKKPEIASVIASYTATGPEQLSLQPGQLIQVRKKSPSGWWEGELQARGQKRKIGWFPANYVKLLGASSKPSTPDTTLQAQSGSPSPASTINRTNTPTIPPPQLGSQPTQPDVKYIDQVVALYPYQAQNDDELTFHNGSVINVISKDDANWWSGECNGQSGMFPSNYVDALTMSSPPQEPTWSSDPAVLAETSAQESKRQNYIHEMINTEITYMDDMSVVLDVFYKPLLEGNGMTKEELDAIFVNWNELIVCNTKLSKSMKVRKKMCGKGQVIRVIGDILCENLPHLTPYIRFCSCQLNAAALLQHKTENAPEFKELHKKCVTDPRTKGMPLSSFLLKPMQRITKYPLMIGKILQYTPDSHPDHQNLTDALSKAEELCSQVNEGVRERENSDRLEWILSHVQCEGLPEKITFNSVTNCLGPRKVLYSGTLYKNKSNKELVGFLFNDFLLLAVPLTSSTSVFVFDPKAKAQYKMYKSPIFLNEVMVKKSTDEDSETCQFQLSHIDRVFNLRATNQTERDAWCKNIEAASRHYLETEKRKREKTHQSVTKTNIGRLLVIITEGINLTPSQDVRHTGGVGRLLVLILEACHLQPSDDNGKSDPFCEVSMGVQEHKTKVINATLNPKWNQSMQFTIRDVEQDVLCITVFDRDLFSPNDFLGRTEICVKEILDENKTVKGPITKRLLLHEVSSGEVLVKLDLQLYDKDT